MKTNLVTFFLFLFVPQLIFGVTLEPKNTKPVSVQVMTYNVENLFDTTDDPDKEDEAFLPLELKQNDEHKEKCNQIHNEQFLLDCLNRDWSKDALNEKLKRLAQVFLQENAGRGPDVLILQEVENIEVLKKLNDEFLQAAGYNSPILLEGVDRRGIDIAMLTRLAQLEKPQLLPIELTLPPVTMGQDPLKIPIRGILLVALELPNKEPLYVAGLHFPVPGMPPFLRRQAIDVLLAAKNNLPKEAYFVVGGDFNITQAENETEGFFSKVISQDFMVSHLLGCNSCPGTHNYEGDWSFLDSLLFSKNFSDNQQWELDSQSIRLVNKVPLQVTSQGTPAHYQGLENVNGVSDHWPLAATILLKP